MLDTPDNRELLIDAFPELATDTKFLVTSEQDPNYNCIAWADLRKNVWWQACDKVPFKALDGVTYDWPLGSGADKSVEGLAAMFESLGYEPCDDHELEIGYRKLALYSDENGDYTHAARQKRNGVWTSKLGSEFDIDHGTPFSIENDDYGKAVIFMKKVNK